jgi:hypothetical protein
MAGNSTGQAKAADALRAQQHGNLFRVSHLVNNKWQFILAPPCFSTACVENFSRFLRKMSCSSGGAVDFSSANAWSCETQRIAFWLFGACGNVVYAV